MLFRSPLVDMAMMRIRGVWTVNAAAFLVGAGIHAQRDLFARIADQAEEIKRLRELLRLTAREALSATSAPPPSRQQAAEPRKPSKIPPPKGRRPARRKA